MLAHIALLSNTGTVPESQCTGLCQQQPGGTYGILSSPFVLKALGHFLERRVFLSGLCF